MQMLQNRNFSRKLFLIFGQLFSLLHYPLERKFLFDYAFIEDIKSNYVQLIDTWTPVLLSVIESF